MSVFDDLKDFADEQKVKTKRKELKVFKCPKCGYEDSSILPFEMMVNKNDGKLQCPQCEENVQFEEFYSDYGKGMTEGEYLDLINYIKEEHGWNYSLCKSKSKRIKYVRCSFDTRTNSIFVIELDQKVFAINNQNKHRDLKKWVYEYLNSERK